MAVTQNLARLSFELLASCTTSVDLLNSVCSFHALDPQDYLDLDWAPFLLEQVAVTAMVPNDLQAALRRAMTGDREVNPDYRDATDTIWEHPVASLLPADVLDIAAALVTAQRLSPINARSVDRTLERLRDEGREVPDDALDYAKTHFDALCDFYRGAAQRQLGAVMWWD